MIARYSRPQMSDIWSLQQKFAHWFEIELHALQAMAQLGIVPQEAVDAVKERGQPPYDVDRILAIEKETKHDVIAFLTHLSERVGSEARFVHQGMTSSDILDTCLSLQLRDAATLLLADLEALLLALKGRAKEHKFTPSMGRSHGIHAEPLTFGFKLAGHYAAFARCKERLIAARKEIAVCAISGPVGTFSNISPQIQDYVAQQLGLESELHSTQIIPRDRHAAYFCTLGVIASCIENLATEIRHLQRTEVYEAEEFFEKGQKGSSAMPHKRNPVLTENLTGLARIVRSSVTPALENVTLWHERDISHSSVERAIAPDATVTLDFALARLTQVVENLQVYPERMQKNIDQLSGLHNSQRILLALTQKGLSREEAYSGVQRNAMKVWREGADFLTSLKQDELIQQYLEPSELESLFDQDYYYKNIEQVFTRIFGSD